MTAMKILTILIAAGGYLLSQHESVWLQTLSVKWAEQDESTPGKVFRDRLQNGGEGPEMVVIPAGKFRMGDIQGTGGKSEHPVHEVHIGKHFAMGRYEITFDVYDGFAKATGRKLRNDRGWGRGSRPVIMFHGKTHAIMPHGCRNKLASAIDCRPRPNGSMPRATAPRLAIGGETIF